MDSTYCRVLDRPSSSCELSALYCILITFLERTVLSSPCSSTDYSTHASSTDSVEFDPQAARSEESTLVPQSKYLLVLCVRATGPNRAHSDE
jgi:hypothetical protein